MSNYSIVEYFGSNNMPHQCGYCKQTKPQDCDSGKFRCGLWAHTMSNDCYQNLIDRGWRRSGKYCYKPFLDRSCCPMYTIRCDAPNFKLSKSQKKVIKKFNRFLKTGEKPKKITETQLLSTSEGMEVQNIDVNMKSTADFEHYSDVKKAKCKVNATSESAANCAQMQNKNQTELKSESKASKHKAKAKRIERKIKKIMTKEKCDESTAKNIMQRQFESKIKKSKTIENYIIDDINSTQSAHKLEVKFVSTTNDEYKRTFEQSLDIYSKYQIAIHKDRPEDCTAKQYKRFLIDSPLEMEHFDATNSHINEFPTHFGSFHEQFWLDGILIAVGVIDVLPNCVSSVYLYYDPNYDFLSLGTYSALREIYLVRQLQRFVADLKYYYMGFYIHSCPKMRYKGKFSPSELLCPKSYSWHPIGSCIPKLELSKYSIFNESANDETEIDEKEIMILYNRKVIPYYDYKKLRKNVPKAEDQQIREYAKFVGRNVVNDILLYRSADL